MRALILLFLVCLSFVLVRWFLAGPEAAIAGAESSEERPGSELAVRFLEPPREASLGLQPATQAESQADRAGAEDPQEGPSGDRLDPGHPGPPWQGGGGSADEAEIAAAAALLHGTPADVQTAAAGLDRELALAAESFAWALAGERQLAHSLAAKIGRGAIAEREHALLEAVLTGRTAAPAPAGARLAGRPLVLAMEAGLLAREAREALASHRYAAAARGYSELLQRELDAPWPADAGTLSGWASALAEAQRYHRWSPRGDWPGVEVVVQEGDNLILIRKRFLEQHPGAVLCTGLIERANAVRGYLQPGQVLRIPTDPARVLVDLDARWALFFLGEEVAGAWPVGIGRPGEETPPGDYVSIEKTENPPWMKVGQEVIPFGDPRNPLGTRWIGWSQGGRKTSYGFHGTKEPESIGKAESDGCVRFRNPDIEELFQILPEGAAIQVRP
jgi:hypothetical protein